MQAYRQLLTQILEHGRERDDRTGTGTISLFGPQIGFDLTDGFPAVTGKKLMFDSVKAELLWFLSGSTNTADLDCGIWDEWADDEGEVGPCYGKQWRLWEGEHDQIATVIRQIQEHPFSRRHIVSAWNVADLDEMALPPCHVMFQFYVRELSGRERVAGCPRYALDCKMTQRSADCFLGVPFNIASYALLTHMMAQVTGCVAGDLVISFGDAHIYQNHLDQVDAYLNQDTHARPVLSLNEDIDDIDDFEYADIALEDYTHGPYIEAPIAT